MSSVMDKPAIQYVYDLGRLDRVPDGPTSVTVTPRRLLSGATLETSKSSTVGAGLFGTHLILALASQVRGSGTKAHNHPNEQFNYILQGTMLADIEGNRIFASAGNLQHTPTLAIHTGVACPDEDLMWLAMKDTRHGISGPPVDGKHDGPLYLPGFGKRAAEKCLSTAQTIEESRRTLPVSTKNYIYDVKAMSQAPSGSLSAAVETRKPLTLASAGTVAAVSGEMLHVAVVHLPGGAVVKRHTHGSEQFSYVLKGELEVDLEGGTHRVPEGNAIHVPAGMGHAIRATGIGESMYIVLKNKHYGIEPKAA
jgi:quercetin dioxygenase-like cupin family protein